MTSDFIKVLETYVPYDAGDAADRQFILDFYRKHDGDVLTRENEEGHLCASAWVVNPSRTKVLMAWHNIYKSFGWLGGHADGERDMAHVAAKELGEETGLKNFKMLGDAPLVAFNVPVVEHVKNGKLVKAHRHFGLVYLFEADEGEATQICEGENSAIKWIPVEHIPGVVEATDSHMLPLYERMIDKVKKEYPCQV